MLWSKGENVTTLKLGGPDLVHWASAVSELVKMKGLLFSLRFKRDLKSF